MSDGGNRANETAEDVLEDTFVTLLEPLYDRRPNLEKYPCASKAEGGLAIAIHPKRFTLVTTTRQERASAPWGKPSAPWYRYPLSA